MMLIDTIHGPMDESSLKKVEGFFENENENTSWVEYWLNDELVHRSAHVNLKQGADIGTLIAESLA